MKRLRPEFDPGTPRFVRFGSLLLLAAAGCQGPEGSSSPAEAGGPVQDGATPRSDGGAPPDSRATSDAPAPPASDGGASGSVGPLDILIVIQSSITALPRQQAFRAAVGALFEPLRALPGGLPDLQVGIVSADLGAGMPLPGTSQCTREGGDKAELQARPGCGLSSGRYVVAPNGGRTGNFSGKLEDVVGCLAALGNAGCGYEMFLGAMSGALGPNLDRANAGFIRKDARLLILLVGDEDDCSNDGLIFHQYSRYEGQERHLRCAIKGHTCGGNPVPGAPYQHPFKECGPYSREMASWQVMYMDALYDVGRFYDFLWKWFKPAHAVYAAAIAGWPADPQTATYRVTNLDLPQGPRLGVEPICQGQGGPARAGLRLKAFADAFGPRGRFESVCNDDMRPGLRRIGEMVAGDLARTAGLDVTIDPPSYNFGAHTLSRPHVIDFLITNNMRTSLPIVATLAGPSPRSFVIDPVATDSCAGRTLAPGGSCKVRVRYTMEGGGRDVTALLQIGTPPVVVAAALFGTRT